MKKIIFLIPVFNDWDSLKRLMEEINQNISNVEDFLFECIVINDASTILKPELKRPKNIKSFQILNMSKNKGHARCNAFGIRYINENKKFDYVILMDGDGEDRPEEIKTLINSIKNDPANSVVAKRVKRSEGPIFQFLYFSHKILTFFFTGKKINFGNYCCLTKKDVEILSSEVSLWSSFTGTVKKKIKNFNEIASTRGLRYFGPSQMSLFKLIIHSFSIIAVFKYQVLFRSIFILFLLYYLNSYLGLISIIIQIIIIIFNILIFLVSLREKKEELLNSQEDLKEIIDITH